MVMHSARAAAWRETGVCWRAPPQRAAAARPVRRCAGAAVLAPPQLLPALQRLPWSCHALATTPSRLSRSAQRARASASRDDTGAPRADARARIWVKPAHLAGSQYAEVAGVQGTWDVARLRAHVRATLALRNVATAQLTLSLVARGGGMPDAAAERAAARLDDPSALLSDCDITDGCWLLAGVYSAAVRAPAVIDVTLLTDLVDSAQFPLYCVPRLSDVRLREILACHNAIGLVADARVGAPLLNELDQLNNGATYYIVPAVTNEVQKLRENTNNIDAALENEVAECLRHALQRRHTGVERVCAKVLVPSGAKMLEVAAVVLADSCAAVAEVKTVLNELSGTQIERTVRIINEKKDAPDCPPELRRFAGKRIIPVLAGRIIKPLSKNWTVAELTDEWRSKGIAVLLPSGDSLGFDDSCVQGALFDAA